MTPSPRPTLTHSRELARWTREHETQRERLAAEKRKSDEVLKPLRSQLSDLERSIEEQQRLVYAATAATLQNEAAVRQLLEASVQTQPR